MDKSALEKTLAALPIAQYAFFRSSELEFSPRIRAVCEQECPRCGKSWSCPPAVGSVETCERRCRSYPEGLLIVSLAETDDIADTEAALKTRPAHEALTRCVADILKAQGLETFVLSAESCAVCDTCTYPDAPCRHPEKMLPCAESHGIVITALAEKYGIDYQYGNNVVSWFSLLFFREA